MIDASGMPDPTEPLARAMGRAEVGGALPAGASVAEVLLERARALARPIETGPVRLERGRVLLFTLGAQRFAVDVGAVEAVIRIPSITQVPGAPDAIVGIALHRGNVIPIVDVRSFVGEIRSGDHGFGVVVRASDGPYGLLADEVVGVVPHGIVEAPASSDDAQRPSAVTRVGDEVVVMLDPDAIARDPRVVVDESL